MCFSCELISHISTLALVQKWFLEFSLSLSSLLLFDGQTRSLHTTAAFCRLPSHRRQIDETSQWASWGLSWACQDVKGSQKNRRKKKKCRCLNDFMISQLYTLSPSSNNTMILDGLLNTFHFSFHSCLTLSWHDESNRSIITNNSSSRVQLLSTFHCCLASHLSLRWCSRAVLLCCLRRSSGDDDAGLAAARRLLACFQVVVALQSVARMIWHLLFDKRAARQREPLVRATIVCCCSSLSMWRID